jgi:hypothetical protein
LGRLAQGQHGLETGQQAGEFLTLFPAQPRSNAAEWNSAALSTPRRPGLPTTGQCVSMPRWRSHGALSLATGVRHKPTPVASGATHQQGGQRAVGFAQVPQAGML